MLTDVQKAMLENHITWAFEEWRSQNGPAEREVSGTRDKFPSLRASSSPLLRNRYAPETAGTLLSLKTICLPTPCQSVHTRHETLESVLAHRPATRSWPPGSSKWGCC